MNRPHNSPQLRWYQLHLVTVLVVVFLACLLLWANYQSFQDPFVPKAWEAMSCGGWLVYADWKTAPNDARGWYIPYFCFNIVGPISIALLAALTEHLARHRDHRDARNRLRKAVRKKRPRRTVPA